MSDAEMRMRELLANTPHSDDCRYILAVRDGDESAHYVDCTCDRPIRAMLAAEAAAIERCIAIARSHAAPKGVPQIDYDQACEDIASALKEGASHVG